MPTVDTHYRAKRAATLANPTAETTFKQALDDTTKPVLTYIAASGKLSGQGVQVTMRGYVVVGTSGNVSLFLRAGTTTAGILLATGVGNPGVGNWNFELNFEGVFDPLSDSVRGRMFGHIGGVVIAEVINSTSITGYDPDGAVDVPITASALFAATNAGNAITLTELVTGTA